MSELQFYNSLTRQKEIFTPLNPGRVGMYVCGMTVYDYCHIGHARVMIVFDVIARHLRALGYELNYIRNITDIDDKIIRRAGEAGIPIDELTAAYISAMHEDETALGCLPPDDEPRATANIDVMIALTERLIAKGHAYPATNGDVYFSVRSFPEYGKLSNRNPDELRAGERIAVNEAKNDPLDFVLWKAAKPGEPAWKSPWGAGRPGWHLECSVMSVHALGEHFDIHGGGMDLKFPHHECEIAQSEGDLGHQHVNYWLHNGFVQIDNEKMSKSLGNFFTVREVLAKYPGEVIRFFILGSHYRGPLNYSDSALEEAKKGLTRLYTALENTVISADTATDTETIAAFEAAMNDDFNTPKALAILFETAKTLNKTGELRQAATLKTLGARLGILQQTPQDFLKGTLPAKTDEADIERLLAQRITARNNKDFARADAIRAELADMGIDIKDTKDGTQWHYR